MKELLKEFDKKFVRQVNGEYQDSVLILEGGKLIRDFISTHCLSKSEMLTWLEGKKKGEIMTNYKLASKNTESNKEGCVMFAYNQALDDILQLLTQK